ARVELGRLLSAPDRQTNPGTLAVERLDLGREAYHRYLVAAEQQLGGQERPVGSSHDQYVVNCHLAFPPGPGFLLAGRCRMPGFWASLAHQKRGEPGAEVRVTQAPPELGLDQAVGDPLVVVVKAARHRREPGRLERHERRRGHPEQPRSMSDDRLR